MDELIEAFFTAVSFPAGGRPDYGRIRALFIPSGLLISQRGEVTGVEAFIAPRQATVDSGALTEFEERELRFRTERFGNVAHRFSGYSKRGVLDGEPFAARGVISTQFVLTAEGWRMSAMAWDDERDGLTLPDTLTSH